MPGGRRNERLTSAFFEDSAADPAEEGELLRNGFDLRAYLNGIVQSIFNVRVSAADTTPASLFDKIDASGDLNKSLVNPGANELLRLLVNVGQAFAADFIQTSVTRSTSDDVNPVDLFAPVSPSPTYLSPSVDGDYVVFVKADARVDNSNGQMSIGVAKTSVIAANEEADSITIREGQAQASSVVLFRLNGLTTSDQIYAWFRKSGGSGNAFVFNRAMFIIRVA